MLKVDSRRWMLLAAIIAVRPRFAGSDFVTASMQVDSYSSTREVILTAYAYELLTREPTPTPAPPAPPAPTPPTPSNNVKLSALKRSAKGAISFQLAFPAAGKYSLGSRAKRGAWSMSYSARRTGTVAAPTAVAVVLKPSSSAWRALKRYGKLPVKLAVDFTPTGGKPRTINRDVTLKAR